MRTKVVRTVSTQEQMGGNEMDQKLLALFVFGVIALVIDGSEAINCYSCDSRTSSNCLDPFSARGVATCTGATCTKGWASGSGVTVVIRDCDHTPVEGDLCVDTSVSGIRARGCVCRSNYCNDGGMLRPTFKILVATALTTMMAITLANKI